MPSDKIPHNSFSEGFKVGYQLVHGAGVLLPLTPMAPMTPMGSTAFLEGVRAGIEAAGARIEG